MTPLEIMIGKLDKLQQERLVLVRLAVTEKR
jgi:hypothetical protein